MLSCLSHLVYAVLSQQNVKDGSSIKWSSMHSLLVTTEADTHPVFTKGSKADWWSILITDLSSCAKRARKYSWRGFVTSRWPGTVFLDYRYEIRMQDEKSRNRTDIVILFCARIFSTVITSSWWLIKRLKSGIQFLWIIDYNKKFL